MKADELAILTMTWRGLPWETRDLFARWLAGRLAGRLADLEIDRRRRLAVQEALLDLEGDAPDAGLGRRVRLYRRERGMSQEELGGCVASYMAEVTP